MQLLPARGTLEPAGELDDVGCGVELRRLLQERQVNPRSCLSKIGDRVGIGTRFTSHPSKVPMPFTTQPSEAGRAIDSSPASAPGDRAL